MKHGRLPLIVTFLVPPLLLYVVFVVSPYLQAFQISTTDWLGYSAEANPVGMANFRALWHDDYVWNALKNNAILLALVPVFTIAFGLFFATMLSMGGRRGRAGVTGVRGGAFYRTVYFFPQVLSVVIIAALWKEVYHPTSGLLNGILGTVGVSGPAWLGDPDFAFWCVLAVMVWSNVGFYVVLFGAAMSAIPRRSTRRCCSTGRPGGPPCVGSPSRCSGTPCRSPGSTWPSRPWTGSSWCSS